MPSKFQSLAKFGSISAKKSVKIILVSSVFVKNFIRIKMPVWRFYVHCSQVASLEAAMIEKKRQVEKLVNDMKEANLQSLAVAPAEELKLLLEGKFPSRFFVSFLSSFSHLVSFSKPYRLRCSFRSVGIHWECLYPVCTVVKTIQMLLKNYPC